MLGIPSILALNFSRNVARPVHNIAAPFCYIVKSIFYLLIYLRFLMPKRNKKHSAHISTRNISPRALLRWRWLCVLSFVATLLALLSEYASGNANRNLPLDHTFALPESVKLVLDHGFPFQQEKFANYSQFFPDWIIPHMLGIVGGLFGSPLIGIFLSGIFFLTIIALRYVPTDAARITQQRENKQMLALSGASVCWTNGFRYYL